MFIRKRQSTKSPCYQVIETYREGGKVCQRVIYASFDRVSKKGRKSVAKRAHHDRGIVRLIASFSAGAFQMTIRSLATMISPLKDFAAPARHSSSLILSRPGVRWESTKVLTPASRAMRPLAG
jgi:hypothetical protein